MLTLDLRPFARQLDALGARAVPLLGQFLRVEGEQIMTEAKRRVPVDLGTLRDSGVVDGPEIAASVLTVTLGFGGPAAGYAVYVHEGTGPAVGRPAFMPPTSALRGWAQRHGIPESALFALARSIGRRGLTPRKFLEGPALEASAGMGARLGAAIGGAIGQSLGTTGAA